MNIILKSLILLMVVSAAYGESKMNSIQVKNKYNIIEGVYKLAPGSHKNCVSGELKIFEGTDGILSLEMGGGFLALHLEFESYKNFEKNCTLVIKNTKIKKGFFNEEVMVCVDPKLTYSRTFKAEFEKNKFTYELRSKRLQNNRKSLKACYLNKIK